VTEPADAGVERIVERGEQEQQRRDHGDDRRHQQRLDDRALPAVGEEERVDEDDRPDEEEHDPERRRDHPDRAVDTVLPRLLAL